MLLTQLRRREAQRWQQWPRHMKAFSHCHRPLQQARAHESQRQPDELKLGLFTLDRKSHLQYQPHGERELATEEVGGRHNRIDKRQGVPQTRDGGRPAGGLSYIHCDCASTGSSLCPGKNQSVLSCEPSGGCLWAPDVHLSKTPWG